MLTRVMKTTPPDAPRANSQARGSLRMTRKEPCTGARSRWALLLPLMLLCGRPPSDMTHFVAPVDLLVGGANEPPEGLPPMPGPMLLAIFGLSTGPPPCYRLARRKRAQNQH